MSWNYRLVKKTLGQKGVAEETVLEVTEIYYDEDGNIYAYANAPIPYGETVDEVRECLRLMMGACDEPIIESLPFDNEDD